MKLDYYTLLCPEPISLSIGTIKHPTLRSIGKLTYKQFSLYQIYLKITPEEYYKVFKKERLSFWESLDEDAKKDITIYDLFSVEPDLPLGYLEIFNFFFVERVIYQEGIFILVNTDDYTTPDDELEFNQSNCTGVITEKTFAQVIDVLQQVCCIKSDDLLDEPEPVFKNEKARKMYEKMKGAKSRQKKETDLKNAPNYFLANIISAVASKSTNLNIVDIWDLTLFQLYDQFGRIRADDFHYLSVVRTAVWGDEKKQFDEMFWYRNNFDKTIQND